MYDLHRQRFSNLTVLRRQGSRVRHHDVTTLWQCRCDLCGTEAIYRSDRLRAGKAHCACEQHYGGKPLIPLWGFTFGTLRVIGREPGQGHGARWRCRCLACGAERVALSDKLRDGRVRCSKCPKEVAAERDWSKEWPSWELGFEDSEEAIADHGSRCVSTKGGRPRLPAEELERREAAKKPPGRPKYTGTHGERVRNECERLIADAGLRWLRWERKAEPVPAPLQRDLDEPALLRADKSERRAA
jgi:hypothetical protein